MASVADDLQARGRYVLTQADLAALPIGAAARKLAVNRLIHIGRLRPVGRRRGVWVIVPHEYRAWGGPPASWVVDGVMRALGEPYYVGLRSAAMYYGATHHAVQVLQVMVGTQLKLSALGRERVRTIVRTNITATPRRQMPGQVAPLWCSTPCATAMDLVRYMETAGGLSTVGGVLLQMREAMEAADMTTTARALDDAPTVQRLGYLLDLIGAAKVADACAAWLRGRSHRMVPLEHGRGAGPLDDAATSPRWKLWLNATPDLSL